MKKLIFLGLIIFVTLGSYAQEKKSAIEGAWQLVHAYSKSGDKITDEYPVTYTGGQMKMWDKDNWVFVGIAKAANVTYDLYGGGTYTLNGDRYIENIIYHNDRSLINTKFKTLLEIRNDTLIQTSPVDDNGQVIKGEYSTEKYVRLK